MRKFVTFIMIMVIFAGCKKPENKIEVKKQDSGLEISESIDRALTYLENRQERNGDFPSLVCRDYQRKKCMDHKGSVFSTTFVVHSVNKIKNKRVEKIASKGLDFIRSKKEKGDIWRFWGTRIDPDLDDTSCSSYLISKNGEKLNNKDVILNNRNEKGLFNTWIRKSEVNDAEGVVNANVLMYLGENIHTVKACRWIVSNLLSGKGKELVHYYPDVPVLFYTISRAHSIHDFECVRKHVPVLVEKAAEMIEGYVKKNDFLNVAFLLNTLLNFNVSGKELKQYSRFFIKGQNSDGSWKSSLFFLALDPPETVSSSYFYSENATTALVLEFLSGVD